MKVYKFTEGVVVQVFTQDGRLIEQRFEAGTECDYEDEEGNYLGYQHPYCDFYYPFEMMQP